MYACHKPISSCLLEDHTDSTKQQFCSIILVGHHNLESAERVHYTLSGKKKMFICLLISARVSRREAFGSEKLLSPGEKIMIEALLQEEATGAFCIQRAIVTWP